MKRTVRVTLLLVLLLLPRGVTAASAADSGPASGTMATATIAAVNPAPAIVLQDQTASGLPERAAPPRTLRAYWHLFVAFAVTWLLVFGYALTIGRRFGRLEEELRRGTAQGSPPR